MSILKFKHEVSRLLHKALGIAVYQSYGYARGIVDGRNEGSTESYRRAREDVERSRTAEDQQRGFEQGMKEAHSRGAYSLGFYQGVHAAVKAYGLPATAEAVAALQAGIDQAPRS